MYRMTDENRVFKDQARRELFWERFSALIEEFPEMIEGLDGMLEGEIDERGILYDADSPKFVQGSAIVMSIRNLDHWESMFVIDPPEQSHYFTYGLIATAMDMQ